MAGTADFKKLYHKLNANQKMAVDAIEGPVIVLAGPGTGKTQVLTMRIANILLKTDAPADAILALTFTESGVKAMQERLISITGTEAYSVNIYTFHSFCSDIIRANPDEFIISAQTEALSDLERVHLFKSIFDELRLKGIKPFNAPYFYLSAAISKIKDLKREGISPEEYEQVIKKSPLGLEEKDVNKNLELIKVYKAYEKRLKAIGRYDFEDMINLVAEKFEKSPSLLQKYQERFQYFLVDEFQDTNSAQAEILYKLSSFWDPSPNLFVVGDDDQSIFRFQGASIENITRFNEKYPNAQKITLNTNYRSIQPIISAADKVIASNIVRVATKLKLDKAQTSALKSSKSEKAITRALFPSSHIENYYVAREIKDLIRNGADPSEIALIYRNNADSIDIADMLSRMDIKYVLEGGENVLETGIIIRLLHLLRSILYVRTKEEDVDLFTLLNYEFLKIDPLDVLKLSRFASSNKQNLFDAANDPNFLTQNPSDYKKITDLIKRIIYWNELSSNAAFVEFLDAVINESGFLGWILNHPNSYEYLNKLNSFLSEVKRLNYSNKGLSLQEFLQYIDLMDQNNIPINEETLDLNIGAVRLLTAHKAKGLEFEYVFLIKFIDKKWSNVITRDLIKIPSSILETIKISNEKDRKLHQTEDDRRLFYVALTRAKKRITLTASQNYQDRQSLRETIISMFTHELPSEFIQNLDTTEYQKGAAEILKQLLKPMHKDHLVTENEKEFLKESLKNLKLSPSSLNTYLECAYKFKLEFLLKTPKPREKSLILGTGIHKALEEGYKKLKQSLSVDLEFLQNKFSSSVSKEILKDLELQEIIEEGKAILRIYYLTYEDEFKRDASHVLYLEKFFGWGWSRPMLDGQIQLSGKIDRIEVSDPSENIVKIIDYKTGRPKSRNEITGQTKYSTGDEYRQLVFYKLLIELDNSINLKVNEVEIDFIGNRNLGPKREKFEVGDEDIEKLKDVIRKTSEYIKNLNFDKTDNYQTCTKCRFRHHCWPDGIPSQGEKQIRFI